MRRHGQEIVMDHPMRDVEDTTFFGIDFGGNGRVRLDASAVLRNGSLGTVTAIVFVPLYRRLASSL
jgi:hypothetical protein